jgi:hypothetical protein
VRGLFLRVIVNFQLYKRCTIHTMAEDCRTRLSPLLYVSGEAALMREMKLCSRTTHAGGSWSPYQRRQLDVP